MKRERQKKCDKCFQYNPLYRKHCLYCGELMPPTGRKLTLMEKVKRMLGL